MVGREGHWRNTSTWPLSVTLDPWGTRRYMTSGCVLTTLLGLRSTNAPDSALEGSSCDPASPASPRPKSYSRPSLIQIRGSERGLVSDLVHDQRVCAVPNAYPKAYEWHRLREGRADLGASYRQPQHASPTPVVEARARDVTWYMTRTRMLCQEAHECECHIAQEDSRGNLNHRITASVGVAGEVR